jgi:hypothetical protein
VILSAVIFATLSLDGLRPRTGEPADVELAFAALCGLSYSHIRTAAVWLCALFCLGAGPLKQSRIFFRGSARTFADFATKAFGSIAETVMAVTLDRVARLIELAVADKN